MGTLTINTFLTLDGVMQSPGAPTEDPMRRLQAWGLARPLRGS